MRLRRSTMKKYYILSDIHSQFELFTDAISRIDFDEDNPNHVLIIAGDILDRGKQGDSVIKYLEKYIIQNRVLGVIGNHDAFLIDILNPPIPFCICVVFIDEFIKC